MVVFITILTLSLLCVVIYETNVLEAGSMADKKQDEFFALTVLELASLAGVVLARSSQVGIDATGIVGVADAL